MKIQSKNMWAMCQMICLELIRSDDVCSRLFLRFSFNENQHETLQRRRSKKQQPNVFFNFGIFYGETYIFFWWFLLVYSMRVSGYLNAKTFKRTFASICATWMCWLYTRARENIYREWKKRGKNTCKTYNWN